MTSHCTENTCNSILLHGSSPTTRVKLVSKSSTKPRELTERKEQNTESVSTSKERNDQSKTKEKSVIILGYSMVKHLNCYEILRKL